MTASYKKRLAMVFAVMVLLALAAAAITALTGGFNKNSARLNIVASFLPVYGAALQVTDGVGGVEVENLVPPQTGCMHDYQMTPDNAVTLSKADVLVINGAGAEGFLGNVKKQYPKLNIIDTSNGIALKRADHHHDEHDEHNEHDGTYNEHIWTSPSFYKKQVENLRDGLIGIDPEHADRYRENAERYISKIESLRAELLAATAALPTKNCILFHDSLAYLADELGLNIIASLSAGETALSAAELAKAANAAEQAGSVLLLYDSQYDSEYNSVAEKASFSRQLSLDTAVTGDGSDVWLDAMRGNLEQLKQVK